MHCHMSVHALCTVILNYLYFLYIVNTGDRVKFSCSSSCGVYQTSSRYGFLENLAELICFIGV